jgi:hypothetical protein
VTTLSDCRKYQPEAKPAKPDRAAPLPSGLTILLALESAIDADTAAAGDPISASVAAPVPRPRTKIIILPEGAIVRGRIVRMEHDLLAARFLVSIAFESLEVNGVESPFYAGVKEPKAILREQSWPNGTVVFTKGHVLPAGYVSTWLTVVPKQ